MKRPATQLENQRRLVVARVKKFEKTAHEIHDMADKLHKKMEKLHLDTIATRNRARTARENAEAKSKGAQKLTAPRSRKVR